MHYWQVEMSEFHDLVDLIRIRFERVDRATCASSTCSPLFRTSCCRKVSDVVLSPRFDRLIDVALLLAVVLLLGEEFNVISGRSHDFDGRPDSVWNILELLFCLFFFVEMVLKLGVLGFASYCRSLKNLFDAFVTTTTVAVVILVYVPNFFNDARAIRYVVVLRILRLARLLGAIPSVAFIARTFIAMLPSLTNLLKLLFCIMYLFAALGVAAFGGLINTDPANPRNETLMASDFGQANYYANNFNDLASGFVTCFELLLVNNWFIICDGFVVVTDSKWAPERTSPRASPQLVDHAAAARHQFGPALPPVEGLTSLPTSTSAAHLSDPHVLSGGHASSSSPSMQSACSSA